MTVAAMSAMLTHAAATSAAPSHPGDPVTRYVQVGPNASATFSPRDVKVHLGSTVEWDWASSGHSSTDSTGLNLWDSGVLNAGATFSHIFTAAGAYHYVSTSDTGMGGRITVPMHVWPRTGPGQSLFHFVFATEVAPNDYRYQLQRQREGDTGWHGFGETNQPSSKSYLGVGTWRFRMRMQLYGFPTVYHSGWTPVVSITVTSG